VTIHEQAPRVLEGTAYGRPAPLPDTLLTQVGPGTPCGEFLRRYWQPVSASANVTQRPRPVRLLGEDLVLFRDGQGRPGLLYPHCAHRGTSLLYGHVDDAGIRCCYHGWQFDVEGHCLDQPCEPTRNVNRGVYRQPWYPVEERYGLVWAYLGPPEKMPLLPRFDHMELEEGEHYYVLDNSYQSHADVDGPEVVPYSWLQINDNSMDPFHVYILHSNFSSVQFDPNFAVMPTVEWEENEEGVIYSATRTLPDGRLFKRVFAWIAPNTTVNPGGDAGGSKSLSIFTAVDDMHMRAFVTARVDENFSGLFEGLGIESLKPWTQMSVDERQDDPRDYEAQATQGPDGVQRHSEEHLVRSDGGIVLQRKVLKREIAKVADGEDPINTAFVEGTEVITAASCNFFANQEDS
jgi:phenylpropionate dioxygenase-like ring-hydroxylating dioxygenase large terminal subunit